MAQRDKGKKSAGDRQRTQQEFEEAILTAGDQAMKRPLEQLKTKGKWDQARAARPERAVWGFSTAGSSA